MWSKGGGCECVVGQGKVCVLSTQPCGMLSHRPLSSTPPPSPRLLQVHHLVDGC
jgi:hypothetical protein